MIYAIICGMNAYHEINALVKAAESWSGVRSMGRPVTPISTSQQKMLDDADLESEYDDRLANFYDETKSKFKNFNGFKQWVGAGRPDLDSWSLPAPTNSTPTAASGAMTPNPSMNPQPSPQPSPQPPSPPAQASSDWSSWLSRGDNRKRFRALFTNKDGSYSTNDEYRYLKKYPKFQTGSDALRDRMLSRAEDSVRKFGGPYTVGGSL